MIQERNIDRINPPLERIPEKNPPAENRSPILKGNRVLTFEGAGFHSGPSPKRRGYKLALFSCLAAVIDGLILISLSSLFLISFSLIMKANFGSLAQSILYSQHRLIFFAEIFSVCAWMYMVTVRSAQGSTIGEWVCDLRLGQPQERLRTSYILRVAWRSTLILLTGLVTFPLLSLLFGKDIAGHLSGLRLFSLK